MRVDPKLIIQTLKNNDGKVRQTARQLGISPGTVINWRKQAMASYYNGRVLSTRGLARKSTSPRNNRLTTLSAREQAEIITLRDLRGSGALKIAATLQMPHKYRSVHRFLKAKGLTAPGKNYRRPRYQETTHMYVKNALVPGKLQMDVKYVTPELSGLVHTAYLYAVMDIWSRYSRLLTKPWPWKRSSMSCPFCRSRQTLSRPTIAWSFRTNSTYT